MVIRGHSVRWEIFYLQYNGACPILRDYDYIIKIIVVGDSEVGKSQLVQRFLKNTFNEGNEPTVAFDYTTKIMEVKGKVLRIHLWDMAGRSIFRWMM